MKAHLGIKGGVTLNIMRQHSRTYNNVYYQLFCINYLVYYQYDVIL